MYLKDLAKIIYTEGTCSMSRKITVKLDGSNKVLWSGQAKDLRCWNKVGSWLVSEILTDKDNENEEEIPNYNKGKIIIVY